MALDYGHTCPDIDRSIKTFKYDIKNYLSDMLNDCCPMLKGKVKEDFIEDYVDQMYNDFEDNFENVRKTNENMRKEADRQIDDVVSKIENEMYENKLLNERIESLEEQVLELESQLDAVL